jgi:hypothetical protein
MAPPLRSAAEGHAEGRDQLVRANRALGNPVRGRLRSFGIRLPSRWGTKKFAEAAHQAVRRDNMLDASVGAAEMTSRAARPRCTFPGCAYSGPVAHRFL